MKRVRHKVGGADPQVVVVLTKWTERGLTGRHVVVSVPSDKYVDSVVKEIKKRFRGYEIKKVKYYPEAKYKVVDYEAVPDDA